jgi:hypothetical protein
VKTQQIPSNDHRLADACGQALGFHPVLHGEHTLLEEFALGAMRT